MSTKLQGLASKLAKFQHDAEFEATKLDAKIEEAAGRMPGVFQKAHGRLDELASQFGDVEASLGQIEKVTNGGPPLDQPTQPPHPVFINDSGSARPGQGLTPVGAKDNPHG